MPSFADPTIVPVPGAPSINTSTAVIPLLRPAAAVETAQPPTRTRTPFMELTIAPGESTSRVICEVDCALTLAAEKKVGTTRAKIAAHEPKATRLAGAVTWR